MSENVQIRFEDELNHCNVLCFLVVTDNAANMKCAFSMVEDNDNPSLNDYSSEDQFCDEDNDELVESFEGWTANPLHF